MAFNDLALAVLRGGLPAVLDDPSMTTEQGDNRTERKAPEATDKDREPFLRLTDERGSVTATGVVVGVVAIAATLGLIVWIARAAG